MYNGCMRRGIFHKKLKKAKLFPTVKEGKKTAMNFPNSAPKVSSTREGKC